MPRKTGETLVYDQMFALKQFKQRWDGDRELLFSSLKAFQSKLEQGVPEEQATQIQDWIASIEAIIAALNLVDPESEPSVQEVR